MEKALGLKSNGDGDLSWSFAGSDSGIEVDDVFFNWLDEGGVTDTGEVDCTPSLPSSGWDLGERASGFAMRRPPRDCDRLKSPSILPRGNSRHNKPVMRGDLSFGALGLMFADSTDRSKDEQSDEFR